MYLDKSKYILLFLLGEESGSQIIVIFSKEVVEKVVLLLFLGELMDLGKQLLLFFKWR
jgi:hypothetical protein